VNKKIAKKLSEEFKKALCSIWLGEWFQDRTFGEEYN